MQDKLIQNRLIIYFTLVVFLSTVLYGLVSYQLVFLLLKHYGEKIDYLPWLLLFAGIFIFLMLLAFVVTRRIHKMMIHAQTALRKSEWQYRNILESTVDFFIQSNMQGIIEVVSPSVKAIAGWDPQDMIGHKITDFYVKTEDRELFFQTLVKNHVVHGFEGETKTKDGVCRYYSVSSRLTFDENGRPTGAMSWIRDVTEERMVRQALKESKERTSQIIDFLPDATFAIDLQGVVIAWNRAMEDMTGIKAADMIGKGNYEYSLPLYGERKPILIDQVRNPADDIADQYEKYEVDGEIITAEISLTTPAGKYLALWFKAVPLYDIEGNISGAIEAIRDISQRKYAEETFNTAFHANATPLAITEARKGPYVEVNQALLDASGYTREEVIGRSPAQIGIYSAKTAEDLLEEFTRNGCVRNLESPVTIKDGTQKVVSINADLIYLANQPYILSSTYDITWRKELEENLRQNEAKYRMLTEKINDVVWTCDIETLKFTYVSPSVQRILGFTPEKSLGRKLLDVVDEGFKAVIQRIINNFRKLEKSGHNDPDATLTIETACFHKDGSLRWLESVMGTIRDSQGKLLSLHGVSRDVTSRREAEKELKETRQRMADIIDFLPDATMVIDINGKVMTWNKAAEELTGARAEDVIGKDNSFYSLLFYGTQQPTLIDLVLNPNPGKTYPFFQENAGLMVAENFCPAIGEKGAYIRATASLLYDTENNIVGAIETFRDATKQKEAEDKTKYLSFHDSLTGVYNRAYWEEEMNRIHTGRAFSYGIMVFDVDGLKLINDSFGHQAGDKLLSAAAQVMQESLREGEVLARIGGDEFTTLIPDADDTVLENITFRLKVSENNYNKANPDLPLSISAGYASMENNQDLTIYDLYRQADNMMYREKLRHKRSSRSVIVGTLLRALEAKDVVTKDHAMRLQKLAVGLAVKVGLDRQQINDVVLLSQFHDIGKVGVSDSILFKPGPLSHEEMKEMQRHCEIGNNIALASPDLAHIADGILKHQEWWDGNGYPIGAKGEEIPITSRIIAITDAYDAMISDRPYRKAMDPEAAKEELRRCAGMQFDPLLVAAFLEVLDENR